MLHHLSLVYLYNMSNKVAVGKSLGKIILLGEHSVVYGEPAIAIPFPSAEITTTITESDSVSLKCFNYDGQLADAPEVLLGLKTVIEKTFDEINQPLENVAINIESTIPAERGMGSSAAVANATVRAIYNYFNMQLSEQTLLKLVDISEKIVHGNPSGLDASIVVKERPLYYIKGQDFEQFSFSMDAYLIVADTGEKGNTKFAVSEVRKKYDSDDKYKQYVAQLGTLVNNAREVFIEKNPVKLGTIMNEAQSYLSALGVSNATIDNLVFTSLLHGALGAKLTGGGLGGCMIALVQDETVAKRVSEALITAGAHDTWVMKMESKGEI